MTFNKAAGRQEFRAAVNRLIDRFEVPLQMTDGGEIIEIGPGEFRQLLEAQVPTGTDADLVTARIEEAKRIFQRRGSTLSERRQAVRELADALEPLRQEIKLEMLPKDEQELFRLANGFAIRHNNRDQLRAYDDAIWLRWAFYVYLATIHAVLRVRAREQQATGTP